MADPPATEQRLDVRRPDDGHAVVRLFPAPDPAAPVVLVVPAMGMRAAYYEPFALAVRAAGVAAALSELRGHEAEDAVRPGRRRDFGYADLVDDLRAAVDAVRAARPGAPVVLAGHSLGGHLACGLLAQDAGAADGLLLVAASTTHWRLWSPRHLLLTQGAVVLAALLGHFPGARVGFGGREARGVIRDWARLARTGRLAFGRPAVDHTPGLAGIAVPVLALRVEHDDWAPERAVDGLLTLLPAAPVDSRVLPAGTGEDRLDHFRWARRPATTVAAVTDWLPRVSP